MDYNLSFLTVSEFRAFKKALAVLLRAGMERQTAIDALLDARRQTASFRRAG